MLPLHTRQQLINANRPIHLIAIRYKQRRHSLRRIPKPLTHPLISKSLSDNHTIEQQLPPKPPRHLAHRPHRRHHQPHRTLRPSPHPAVNLQHRLSRLNHITPRAHPISSRRQPVPRHRSPKPVPHHLRRITRIDKQHHPLIRIIHRLIDPRPSPQSNTSSHRANDQKNYQKFFHTHIPFFLLNTTHYSKNLGLFSLATSSESTATGLTPRLSTSCSSLKATKAPSLDSALIKRKASGAF